MSAMTTESFNPDAEKCPECGATWRATEIPGRPGEFYSNLIGIYDAYRDRTVAWMCPACKKEWPR